MQKIKQKCDQSSVFLANEGKTCVFCLETWVGPMQLDSEQGKIYGWKSD